MTPRESKPGPARIAACLLTLVFAPAAAAQSPGAVCPVITGTGNHAWEPVSYFVDEREWHGIMPKVLRKLGAELGFEVEHLPPLPWRRALVATRNGEADVLAGAYYTVERTESFVYSAPVVREPIRVFTRPTQRPITRLDDLESLRGVRPAGGTYGDELDATLDRLGVVEVSSGEQMMAMINAGHADYGVLAEFDGKATARSAGLADRLMMVDLVLGHLDTYFLFSQWTDCRQWLPAINQQLADWHQNGRIEAWYRAHSDRLLQR